MNQINTVIAHYALAGGTRVLFVDMTRGPAERIRLCAYERRRRSGCTKWNKLNADFIEVYGLEQLVD